MLVCTHIPLKKKTVLSLALALGATRNTVQGVRIGQEGQVQGTATAEAGEEGDVDCNFSSEGILNLASVCYVIKVEPTDLTK